PAPHKKKDDNPIADPMPHPDRFGACTRGNAQPVHKAEHSREQSADNAGGDHPKGYESEARVAGDEISDVKGRRRREQTERKDNQHRMNWMSKQFRLHASPPAP